MPRIIDQLPEIPPDERSPLVTLLIRIIKNQDRQSTNQEQQLAYQEQQLALQTRQLVTQSSRIASLEAHEVKLRELVHLQQEQIQALKDEIARLKGHSGRPNMKPSSLRGSKPGDKQKKKRKGKRPGSTKRSKTETLEIHEFVILEPEHIPAGSISKGYEDFTVQDLVVGVRNTVYRRARYATPDGGYVVGKLPTGVTGHFGTILTGFILYQYYHCHVTQPLLHEQLSEWGVDISAGQVNRIITEGKERFHAEKDDILLFGLMVSGYIHVDDTGARHNGKNGYCTQIGNELFAWFKSTSSKSRINFLELLRAHHIDYLVSDSALEYMRIHKLPKSKLRLIEQCRDVRFDTPGQWKAILAIFDIVGERHVRAATEGALIGSLLSHGLNPELVVVSDDAGQFNVLLHALCWIHAERLIAKLVGFNDKQSKALEDVRGQIWDLYQALKAYRLAPDDRTKVELSTRFDAIFTRKTNFATLDQALKRLNKNKSELLLVLDRPDIPLHNNPAERDIRDYVKFRKVSGSTRSDAGRQCRDTFTSLKKTCGKLGVSFWDYLLDRVAGKEAVPWIPELIKQKAAALPRPAT